MHREEEVEEDVAYVFEANIYKINLSYVSLFEKYAFYHMVVLI